MVSARKNRRRGSRQKQLFIKKYGTNDTYSHQIYKLLKCVSPGLSISVLSMNIMNSFVEDLLDRIASEASKLVHYTQKSTMGYDDIIAATKLVITSPQLCELATDMARRTVQYTENH